jgi:putative ABC transport system substrate-binding protein
VAWWIVGRSSAPSGGPLAAPLAAEAQQAGKVWRVGIINELPPPTPEDRAQSIFRRALKDLGWVDGQTIVFEDRGSVLIDRLGDRAAEMIPRRVDLLSMQTTTTHPIVMITAADPVAIGFVAGLARPGGNVTGVTSINRDLGLKRLELIKELLPGVARVALLWNPESPITMPSSSCWRCEDHRISTAPSRL